MLKTNFKRVISMLLILLIMMTTACSTQSTGGNTDTPKSAGLNGTYIGEGQGNNGIVQIETTFVDGKITKVEVKSHSETPGICEVAIENVPKRIIESNSINVDAVSGATNTSNAIISAVKAAIENAGGRVDDYMAQAENEIEKEIINTEVLIVGAGGAGLSAAVSAKENGADVLVIEKNGSVGGATAVSGGGFMGGASKLQAELGVTGDTPEQIFKDLLAGGKDNDETMLWLLANNAGKMVDWLYYDLKLPVNQSVSASVEHTYPRGFSMEGGASAITSSLSDKFKELGGKIMLETKATELIYKDGKVVGVKASGVDKEYEIYADSVILATGGYGANKDLLPESVSKVLYYGPATSTGDGLLMAQKVGAATMYLDHVKIYPQGIEIAEGIGAVATGGSMTATKQEGAIYVNKSGERVVNENAPFTEIRDVTLEQEDQIIYIVMDKPAFDLWKTTTINYKFMTKEQINKFVEQNGGTPLFAHADTIEEAAEIAGINKEKLASTVENWNKAVDAGVDAAFGNTFLNKIDEGPFYIIEQKLRFASTLGGLVVNESLEVLDNNGNPIKGLYAAGEIIGGAHGKDSMPTCNVSWALTTGMLAGRSVTKNK